MVICDKMVYRDEFSPLNFWLLGLLLVEGTIWGGLLPGFALRRLDRVHCHPRETTIPNCLNLWQLGSLIMIEKVLIVLLLLNIGVVVVIVDATRVQVIYQQLCTRSRYALLLVSLQLGALQASVILILLACALRSTS